MRDRERCEILRCSGSDKGTRIEACASDLPTICAPLSSVIPYPRYDLTIRIRPQDGIAILPVWWLVGSCSLLSSFPRPFLLRRCRAPPTASRTSKASGRRPAPRRPISQDHAAQLNMLAGRSVVERRRNPVSAVGRREESRELSRIAQKADPLAKCYMPGVPRIMYLDFPFQIFQTPKAIAMTFEWSLDYRADSHRRHSAPDDARFLDGRFARPLGGRHAGGGRGNNNDKTWFDMAGDFHSDALHVVERYRMTDADTIQYEATIEDSKVFTKPWTISIASAPADRSGQAFRVRLSGGSAKRRTARSRARSEPGIRADGTPLPAMAAAVPAARGSAAKPVADLRRTPDGKPDLQGFYESRRRRRELRSGKAAPAA